MPAHKAYLMDSSSARIGSLAVTPVGDRYEGTISLADMPAEFKQLFAEYEELVEGQVFSRLDEMEGRIAAFRLRVAFDDGTEAAVEDLQVCPSTGSVSFTTPGHESPIGVSKAARIATGKADGSTRSTRAR